MEPLATPLRIIVGLSGYKRSGKDTASEFIADRFLGWAIHRVSFAEPGKLEVAEILGTTLKHLEEQKKHPLVRHIYQWYLNDHVKNIRGEDCWVKALSERVNRIQLNGKNQLILIADVRFPHEAAWIKGVGGYMIMVDRFEKNEDPHPSETEIDKIRGIDARIPNKGTLNALRRECLWVSQYIKERYKV